MSNRERVRKPEAGEGPSRFGDGEARERAGETSEPASLECDHCGGDAFTSPNGLFSDVDSGCCESCGHPCRVSPDDAAPPAAASASPLMRDTTSGDAMMVDELAKQYQKAQIYGSKAQKWRTEALNHGSKTDHFDADPCTDEKALAYARDALRRAREADAQSGGGSGVAGPADATSNAAALAAEPSPALSPDVSRLVEGLDPLISAADQAYIKWRQFDTNVCRNAYIDAVSELRARLSEAWPEIKRAALERSVARANGLSPDVSRLVEELDELRRLHLAELGLRGRAGAQQQEYIGKLTEYWPALSAALRQAAVDIATGVKHEASLRGAWHAARDERDDLKKRLGEAEAKLKKALEANVMLITSIGGSVGVDEPDEKDPTT